MPSARSLFPLITVLLVACAPTGSAPNAEYGPASDPYGAGYDPYQGPAPGYATPAPGYGTPAPGYGAPTPPAYGTPAPDYGAAPTSQPGYAPTYTTAPPPAAARAGMTPTDVQQVLQIHNSARGEVGVGPISWDAGVAVYAEEWARTLAGEGCGLRHRGEDAYGENVALAGSASGAVQSWYSEKRLYRGVALDESNWFASGHYTQMVWRETTGIGCGQAWCGSQAVVVCNYSPPGNLIGQRAY